MIVPIGQSFKNLSGHCLQCEGVMTSGRIINERSVIAMIIQLADTAAAAWERGDNATLDRALRGIAKLRAICSDKQHAMEVLLRFHELGSFLPSRGNASGDH